MLQNKTVKLVSFILILAIIAPNILFIKPKKAEANLPVFDTVGNVLKKIGVFLEGTTATETTTNTAISVKNVAKEVLRTVLQTLAKRFLQQLTKSTINWINSGFHGAPLFLENPESFFRDIAKFQIKDFIDLTGYNNSKFPFGRDFALSTIGAYKRQFSDNAQYTLSKVINDPNQLQKLRTDFAIGGWNGFLTNTQYPQNNYIGYRMLATEELARRLDGTAVSKANQVKDTLQQGLGFLSPKTCPSNPRYNNGKNEFQQPKFNTAEYNKTHPFNLPPPEYEYVPDPNDPEGEAGGQLIKQEKNSSIKAREDYAARWQREQTNAMGVWQMDNTCPDGLKATTPGSVVGNQIMNALVSPQKQGELSVAMGNSISAILDSLLNHFLDKGLTALASTVNPKPKPDDWSYEGQTLGGPDDGTNNAWDIGPDEIVFLSNFKKEIEGKTIVTITTRTSAANGRRPGATSLDEGIGSETGTATTGNTEITTKEEVGKTGNGEYIPGDIENTDTELKLIYNESSITPGLIQVMGYIWPAARSLDICQPGPDLGWKDRLGNEKNRNSQKLQGKVSDQDGEKAAQAGLALKELDFAVNFFQDWIINNMIVSLPNSVLYMDAVDEIGQLAQQSNELTDRRRARTQALGRLQAIKVGLDRITKLDSDGNIIQPPTGSGDERTMISLRKQYNATKISVGNTNTIDEMRNDLAVAREKLAKLDNLGKECEKARKEVGWSVPGGASSMITNKEGVSSTEKAEFCDIPIKSGYNHETFTHANDKPPIPNLKINNEIPYVNALDVMNWRSIGKTILCLGFCGRVHANIKIECGIVWKANVLDYKGNLPGATNVGEPYTNLPEDPNAIQLGTCTFATTGETEQEVTEEQCIVEQGSWTPDEEPAPTQ